MSYPVHYVPAGDVLPIFFSTFDGGTGASITMSGLAATDIEIYKDGSATQRASDAGYTLLDTDGIDFDGVTGIHGFSIDTGDNTDAGFYTVGAWFHVVVSAITVDAQTVSFIAAAFRLMPAESVAGKPKVDVDAWLGTAAATPTQAGVPEVDITHIGGAAVSTSSAQLGVNVVNAAGTAWGSGAITDASIASDAITAAKIANGAIDAATFAADVDAEILSYIVDDATRIDASALNTASVTTIPAILTDTAEIGAAGAGLTEAGGTGDHLTAIPWNAAWDAEVESEVDDALGGGTGTALTAIPWNANWDAEVQSEVQDALDATLADSVPADGSRPSMAQAAYAIYQFLTERAVSGTTLTVKKVDGSTSLMTFTLDDGTNPTSITRAS